MEAHGQCVLREVAQDSRPQYSVEHRLHAPTGTITGINCLNKAAYDRSHPG